ncbi:hypothetical protein CBS101457_001556 [Exobasidium rhododendri]|nr:hypothetical protein CBS101457_001556 [Exobasidium rhododendri]
MQTDRERSQMLRSVSHLDKNQIAEKEGQDACPTSDAASSSAVLSSIDLSPPPPEYRQKQRRSIDALRGRGLSFGDGANTMFPFVSQENGSQVNVSSSSPASSSSVFANQGKAKVAAAAAKLRRMSVSQIGSRRPSIDAVSNCNIISKDDIPTRSMISTAIPSNERSALDMYIQQSGSSSVTNALSPDRDHALASGEEREPGESNKRSGNLNPKQESGSTLSRDRSDSAYLLVGGGSSALVDDDSSSFAGNSEPFQIRNQFATVRSVKLGATEAESTFVPAPSSIPDKLGQLKSHLPSTEEEVVVSPIGYDSSLQATHHHAAVGGNGDLLDRAVSAHEESTRGHRQSKPYSFPTVNIDSQASARNPSSISESPTDQTSQDNTGRRGSRVSFEFSQSTSLDTHPSRSASRPFETLADTVREDTEMVGAGHFASQRRGSAPSDSFGKKRKVYRLGKLKFGGSTIDVNNMDSHLDQRQGLHLESVLPSRRSEDVERFDLPSSDFDSSTHSRISFSAFRRAPSQDGPRPSTFSVFAKFNKSRDQLNLTTLDAADEDRSVGLHDKPYSEVGFSAKQFLQKVLRRPSKSSSILSAAEDIAPPFSSHDNISPDVDEISCDEDTGSHLFAAAFGKPQASNVQTVNAFEGQGEAGRRREFDVVVDTSQEERQASTCSTRRSSQDSSSTSFFSIAETSSHHDALSRPSTRISGFYTSTSTSPYDRSRSRTPVPATRTHSPLDSASRQRVTPMENEGALGEQRQAHSSTTESNSYAPLFLNFDHPQVNSDAAQVIDVTEQRESPFTSPSEHGSAMTHQTMSTTPSSWIQSSDLNAATTSHLERELCFEAVAEAEAGKGKGRESDEIKGRNQSIGAADEQNESTISASNNDESDTRERNQDAGDFNGQNSGSSRRPFYSSRLSHLPRLDSMRIGGAESSGGAGGNGDDGDGGSEDRRGTDLVVGQAEEEESDTDTGDETHDHDRDADGSGTETDTGSEGSVDESSGNIGHHTPAPVPGGGVVPIGSRALGHARMSSGELQRQKPGGIQLPPAPSFGVSTALNRSSTGLDVNSNSSGPAVGKDSWTQFDITSPSSADTPGLFSTPRASTVAATVDTFSQRLVSPATVSTSNLSQTPKSLAETLLDTSYFNIRPSQAPSASGSKANVDMPPPSPSIISRSRAPSSASTRSSMRERPPLPPIIPLQFRAVDGGRPTANSSTPATNATTKLTPLTSTATTAHTPNSPSPSLSSQNSFLLQAKKDKATIIPKTLQEQEGGADVRALDQTTLSSANLKGRPGLYQQQSRSLIDLNSITARNLKEPMRSPLHASKKEACKIDPIIESGMQSPATGTSTPGGLRRRRSMIEVGAQPPPYAVIHQRPEGMQSIFPREEEGREILPAYHCAVHIEGYLPRKMEFSSPGVQAKDRSWRKQYFVLHGTCLKVFKSDLSGENLAVKGAWGELHGVHVHKEPMNEDGPSPPTGSSSNGTMSSKDSASHSHQGNGHFGGGSGNSGYGAAKEAVNALTGTIYPGSKNVLVKTYSLQGAESGLAADYLKRRHVVRVRVGGEQFLLQTRNDRHVVDWIEAFQAATNVALDLEARPMPKFITLPRRRRRRRRDGTAVGGGGANNPLATASDSVREAADLAEAQRRSLADGEGGNTFGRTSRLHPARPLGLPGDESPNPSARFDDMLREEQNDIMRQDASDI